jgi:hypothetical protein
MHVLIDMVDPAEGDHVMFEAAGEIELGQFDLVADDVVDTAHMLAVRPDDFEVFLDLRDVYHVKAPVLMACEINAVGFAGFRLRRS